MKYKAKAVKCTSYVSGIAIISCAFLAAMLLIMAAFGLLFPRKTEITIVTESISKIYDGIPVSESDITVKYGELLSNHKIVINNKEDYTSVGEYTNSPKYKIIDSTGDDVTKMYAITEDFGTINIMGRKISVYCGNKVKQYNGEPLESDSIKLISGELCEGHSFFSGAVTSILEPGVQDILPTYYILDTTGLDVTHEYEIESFLGTLTVEARSITVSTGSAEKYYDGKPLSNDKWEILHGDTLSGHKANIKCITSESDVGVYENRADVWISNAQGEDVSRLYNVSFEYGRIEIRPMVLYIETGSTTQEYNGSPIENKNWKITSGKLGEGESISFVSSTRLQNAGKVKNEMQFHITDKAGNDISHRYDIVLNAGDLTITPKSITIRTGSASKKYDGQPLVCNEFEIIKGSLCSGDSIKAATVSIVNVGYTQNYMIEYTIYHANTDGSITDVSGNYRVSYDYGTLTITN